LHRWRHWILLLLRTAFLLLLLLAFLQPVLRRFGSNPAAQTGRQVLIVLDHSVSMEHKGDGPASRERAVHEASKLMDSLGAQDTVNILLMEPELASCFMTFSKDIAEGKRFLDRLKPGLGRADVNLANAAAARLIGPAAPRPEIYYISDFTRKKWASANFLMLPAAATTTPFWTPGLRKRKCWPATPCRWKFPSAISAAIHWRVASRSRSTRNSVLTRKSPSRRGRRKK
jgi:hypothetical protein